MYWGNILIAFLCGFSNVFIAGFGPFITKPLRNIATSTEANIISFYEISTPAVEFDTEIPNRSASYAMEKAANVRL